MFFEEWPGRFKSLEISLEASLWLFLHLLHVNAREAISWSSSRLINVKHFTQSASYAVDVQSKLSVIFIEPSIKNIISTNFEVLQDDPKTGRTFTQPPIISIKVSRYSFLFRDHTKQFSVSFLPVFPQFDQCEHYTSNCKWIEAWYHNVFLWQIDIFMEMINKKIEKR